MNKKIKVEMGREALAYTNWRFLWIKTHCANLLIMLSSFKMKLYKSVTQIFKSQIFKYTDEIPIKAVWFSMEGL